MDRFGDLGLFDLSGGSSLGDFTFDNGLESPPRSNVVGGWSAEADQRHRRVISIDNRLTAAANGQRILVGVLIDKRRRQVR